MFYQEFDKSSKLDNVAYDVRGPALDAANEMKRAGIEILTLNIGNPAAFGFRAPASLTEEVQRHFGESDGYSDSKGLLSAREAVVGWCEKKGITGVAPDDVYTGNGVSELINMAMQGLLSDGDEILIPAPDYPLWTATATLSGGHVVHYVCDEQSGWLPDLRDMERKITSRTKAIVLINPNNPTGAVYPREILEGVAELAREYGLILFSDEIYDKLVMDGLQHTALASVAPDVFCVTFGGLSKSHRAAGWRVGWMALSGPKRHVKGYIEGLNMLSSMRLCANVPAQHAIAPALAMPEEDADLLPGGRIYERRELITNALRAIPGVSCVKPQAAFYIFPKLDIERFHITDDERFVLDFLREKHVLLVRGLGFHWEQPDHFRIVYLPEPDVLTRSAQALGEFLATYRQE